MSVDRVATNTQSQYMLDQINRANIALNTSQAQVSSGKVANNYAGYGDKTTVLEAARSAGTRIDAYQATTQQALTQVDLQNTQITALGALGAQLRQALTDAVGNNDGSTLMTQAQSIFDQASQVLNSRDANGKYIYGGEKNDTPPFTATSLSDLTSMTNTSDAFANGTIKQSVQVGSGETVEIGSLASDLGTDLMNSLKAISQYATTNGDFTSTITPAQSSFLTTQISTAKSATDNLNNAAAANGFVYNRLQDASDKQDTMTALYKTFVSNVEEVDMPTAVTQLNQNQVALQAAIQVTAQLHSVSLLNYLPQS